MATVLITWPRCWCGHGGPGVDTNASVAILVFCGHCSADVAPVMLLWPWLLLWPLYWMWPLVLNWPL